MKLTALETRAIITDRFPGLVSSKMLTIEVEGNVLTLTGSLRAVNSMDKEMQGLIPNHCKEILRATLSDGTATYKYRFEEGA